LQINLILSISPSVSSPIIKYHIYTDKYESCLIYFGIDFALAVVYTFGRVCAINIRKLHTEIQSLKYQSYPARYISRGAAHEEIEINNRRRNVGHGDKMHRIYCTNARCNRSMADCSSLEKCI